MGDLKTETWRILHIDDDEDDHIIMQSTVREFHKRDVTLVWASSYENGKQKLKTDHYQAVLVDYDLGSRTGIDLIREAVGNGYNTPMILLTGRGSYEVDVEAMQAGAALYLAKDEANPALLERSIRYAIERKVIESRLQTSVTGLARELRERQRVETILWKEREALHDIERKFSRVFEQSICAAALSKLSDGVFVKVNESWERLFGYSKKEVIGKTMQELSLNSATEDRKQTEEQLKENGWVQAQEIHVQTKSGEKLVLLQVIDAIDIGGERYALTTMGDITVRSSEDIS